MTKSANQSPKMAKFQKKHQRQPNAKIRSREYLTRDEVDQLRKAARSVGRNGHRDDTLILLMFRHGLRVSEAIDLQWDQIDLKQGFIHVSRLKKWEASNPSALWA